MAEPDEPLPHDEDEAPQAPSAVDRGSQKRIRDRAKREAAQREEFWRAIFASEVGRREMWAIIDTMHAFKERWIQSDNGSPWTEATIAETGIQRIGFQLFRSWYILAPDDVMKMVREHDPALRPPAKPPRRSREDQW